MNFFAGRVEVADERRPSSSPARAALAVRTGTVAAGEAVTIGVRPEHLADGGDGALALEGEVDAVEHLGEASLVYLRLPDGSEVVARAPAETAATPGERFAAHASPATLHIFDASGVALLR